MLTAKQERFVDEYMVCLNGTRAAIRAGYSAKTARAIASENLKKPEIAAEITRRINRRKKRSESQVDLAVKALMKVATFAGIGELFREDGTLKDPKDWPPEAWPAVQSFRSVTRYSGRGPNRKVAARRVSMKMCDKVEALELLLAYCGAFPTPGRKGS